LGLDVVVEYLWRNVYELESELSSPVVQLHLVLLHLEVEEGGQELS